ncbi:MAG: hypothetical protein FJ317_08535 [SAR202 cluster bacterium]|nr:hypothetical protein [SAR202 cluster bacterium]
MKLAFLFSGGGALGAMQVGFLETLVRRGVAPDLLVGTSVGALNGSVFALYPDMEGVERLKSIWLSQWAKEILGGQTLSAVLRAAAGRNHVLSGKRLPTLLSEHLDNVAFEDLRLPFYVAATELETGASTVFGSGPLIPALLASSALPGILPSVFIDGKEYIDGGVSSHCGIEIAHENGATDILVLHCPHFLEIYSYGPLRPLTHAAITTLNRLCQYELEKYATLSNVYVLEPPVNDMSAYNSHRKGGIRKLIDDAIVWAEGYLDGPQGRSLMEAVSQRRPVKDAR